jgi:hypothetical protein
MRTAEISPPSSVDIVEQGGAFYLLRFDNRGECTADTWHETVDAAKAQAKFEFDIEDQEWRDASNETDIGK